MKVAASELQVLEFGPSITRLLGVRVRHTHTAETLEVCKYDVLTKSSEDTLKLCLYRARVQYRVQEHIERLTLTEASGSVSNTTEGTLVT